MPRRSSQSTTSKGEDRGFRRWRSRSRTRSRSRGRNVTSEASHDGIISTGYASSPGVIGDSSQYTYVTSPPRAKSGLTGNISSLFRTFRRGSSGRSSASAVLHQPYQYSQQQGQAYPSSLGDVTSPENTAIYSRNDVGAASVTSSQGPQFLGKKSRFGFGGNKNSKGRNSNTNSYPIDRSFSGRSLASRGSSRLFYSNADDDSNSENSFDERSRAKDAKSQTGTGAETSFTEESELPTKNILRYRGFSTSIKNLFLDEALVCASMGCFGLILSNRTEYLLQLRNERRGVKWGQASSRRTLPSRILAYALLLTLILIGITFVIGGFGSNSNNRNPFSFNSGYNKGGSSSSNYNDDIAGQYQYNNNDGGANDDANNYADENINNNANDDAENNNGGRHLDRISDHKMHPQHCATGIFKIRDMKESIWEPTIDFLSDEWYRPYDERNLQNYASNDDYSSAISFPKRDIASDLRASLVFAFLIILGILGRRRRMRTRYYLVRARAQEDHLFYASSGSGIKRIGFQDSREDQYEGACSHTLCGCYPIDPPRDGDEVEDEVQVNDDGVIQRKKKPFNEDCVGRGFNCLLGLCCGFVCKCWFQCLSICALAQEAREMRLLVPTRFQRVDYITHQPFHEYQKAVNDLRRGLMGRTRKKSGIMPHIRALSKLSRYILFLSISLSSIIGATLYFNPRASFSWPDVIILSATFLQSFLVLWIVHWIFHKSDLSLDAVIKFFTAGFVIAVPSAFFFEGVLVNLTLIGAVLGYALGQLLGGDTFADFVSQHYRILWLMVEIFNAYIVATVTEELCKYYTFRCVEHPDLIFLTGLVSTTQDERAMEGGVVKYPFSSHQVQRTNARNPYDDDASHYSKSSHRSRASGKSKNLEPDEDEFEDVEEQDVRTYQQKAAAVTTAMISVAVGLACAENFLYVFLLGGTSGGSNDDSDGYLQEWIVLFFRSIFPVHALAAAMQSVNMIRKFVETESDNGHRIGVGRIIMPAVIMHGTFDAILLAINVFIETSWDNYLEANAGNVNDDNPTPYNSLVLNLVAWFSISFVMLAGFIWYYRQYRKQRLRLIEMEEHERAIGTPGYVNPRVPPITNIELV